MLKGFRNFIMRGNVVELAIAERRARGQAPAEATTKQCPECLSEIPKAARACAFCASEQHDAAVA